MEDPKTNEHCSDSNEIVFRLLTLLKIIDDGKVDEIVEDISLQPVGCKLKDFIGYYKRVGKILKRWVLHSDFTTFLNENNILFMALLLYTSFLEGDPDAEKELIMCEKYMTENLSGPSLDILKSRMDEKLFDLLI
jgi:hypothetical protein